MSGKRCFGCMQIRTMGGRYCEHCGYDEQTNNGKHQLPVGTVLKNQYLIGRVLGQGGFGITYLGWDLYLDVPVAIKEYYPSGTVMRDCTVSMKVTNYDTKTNASFQNSRDRFLREAQTLARLNNVQEVVQVRNFFLENNTAYIIMEYVQGTNLRAYVQARGGKLPPAETFAVIRPVLVALQKVHQAGLVHRDISPDNIMLLPNGTVKVLDFGAVRDVSQNTGGDDAPKSTMAILKQGFAPIEQYQRRGTLGAWSDVYALCATVYYCLTGEVPMDAPERLLEETDIVWSAIPGLTPGQAGALERGMALFVKQRTQSAAQLYYELFGMRIPVEEAMPLPNTGHGMYGYQSPFQTGRQPGMPQQAAMPVRPSQHIQQPPVRQNAPAPAAPVAPAPQVTVPIVPKAPEQPVRQNVQAPIIPAAPVKKAEAPIIPAAPVKKEEPIIPAAPAKKEPEVTIPIIPAAPVKKAEAPIIPAAPVKKAEAPIIPAAPVKKAEEPIIPAAPVKKAEAPVIPAAPVKKEEPIIPAAPVKKAEAPVIPAAPVKKAEAPIIPAAPVKKAEAPIIPAAPVKKAEEPIIPAAPVKKAEAPVIPAAPAKKEPEVTIPIIPAAPEKKAEAPAAPVKQKAAAPEKKPTAKPETKPAVQPEPVKPAAEPGKKAGSKLRILIPACVAVLAVIIGVVAFGTRRQEQQPVQPGEDTVETVMPAEGASGEIGPLSWTLNGATGELVITGTGKMPHYLAEGEQGDGELPPWHPYRAAITKVTIGEGVQNIGNNAFHGCTALTTAQLSEGVEYLGMNCFAGTALESINIPGSVKELRSYCFNGTKLKTLELPDSLYMIHTGVFTDCSELTSVTVGPNTRLGLEAYNDYTIFPVNNGKSFTLRGYTNTMAEEYARMKGIPFTSLGTKAWDVQGQCGQKLNWYLDLDAGFLLISGQGKMWDYNNGTGAPWKAYGTAIYCTIIGDEVTYLGIDSFVGTCVQDVYFGSGIQKIGASAFRGTWIDEAVLPNSVTSMGLTVFAECEKLYRVQLPEMLKSLPMGTFVNCMNLNEVFIGGKTKMESPFTLEGISDMPANVTIYSAAGSAAEAFAQKHGMKFAVGAAGLVAQEMGQCGDDVYWFKSGDTLVLYGSGKTWLYNISEQDKAEWALRAWRESWLQPGDTEFYRYREQIRHIIVLPGVEGLNHDLFRDMTNLETVDLGTITEAHCTFTNCSMETVVLPETLRVPGEWMFVNCTKLRSVTILGGGGGLGDGFLTNCYALEEIRFAGKERIRNNVQFLNFDGAPIKDNLVFCVKANSPAEQYARKNNIPYTRYE